MKRVPTKYITYDQTAQPNSADNRPNSKPPIRLLLFVAEPIAEQTATATTTSSAWLVAVRSASTSSNRFTSSLAARTMRFTKLDDDASMAIGSHPPNDRKKPCRE